MESALVFEPVPGLPEWRAAHVAAIGSTNAALAELARAGQAGEGRLWLTAGRQIAGRGRRGRNWASPPGNFAGSVLLVDPAPAALIGTLPLVAGLAARDAIAGELGEATSRVMLKWPNDVLVDGAKCCGILLERTTLRDGRTAVIIGFGVNIATHPDDTPYPTTHLRAHRPDAGATGLFMRLAEACAAHLALWNRGADIRAIRDRWLYHASGLGHPITLRLERDAHSGIFSDIDAEGHLILRLPDDTSKRFAAGDVFFQ